MDKGVNQLSRAIIRDTYGYTRYEVIHLDGETFIYDYTLRRSLEEEEKTHVLNVIAKQEKYSKACKRRY